MTANRKIWIIVPVFDRPDKIYSLINQMLLQTYHQYNLLIVDHGTKKIDFTSFKDPRLMVVRANSNLWWTGAINAAIRSIMSHTDDTDYLLLINDDVNIDEDYLKNLVAVAEDNPDTIIGSTCIDQDTNRIIYTNRIFDKVSAKFVSPHRNQYADELSKRAKEYESHLLYGRGMLIPFKVIKFTGLFDEKHLPHYGADSEFSWRARKQGFKLICSLDCQVVTRRREELLDQFQGSLLTFLTNKKKPGNLHALVNLSFLCFNSFYAVYFIFINLIRQGLSYSRRF